jgi:hypothetical protein
MLRCTRVNPSNAVTAIRAARNGSVGAFFLGVLIAASAPGIETLGPILMRVFPPGAAVGRSETWVIHGRNLARVESVVVEGGGVAARIIERFDDRLRVTVEAELLAQQGFRIVRLEGPDGLSNPRLVRIDQVKQTTEVEPNNTPERATKLSTEIACAGMLDGRDVDHFRFSARCGQILTIEVEARRLGSPIEPVISIMTSEGRALAQAISSPEIDGDCRLPFSVPHDGEYQIGLHDRLYQGSNQSSYRLRITEQPFATGLLPIGGKPGAIFPVMASGGTLPMPLMQTVALSGNAGALVGVAPFDRQVLAPGRLIVGDGSERERTESKGDPGPENPINIGDVMNGRIDRAGEIDRYRLPVQTGQPVRVWVEATRAGSVLDGVLMVRDEKGRIVGEADDQASPFASRRVPLGLSAHDVDPTLTLTPDRDATWSIELTDRFDGGGPGYGYRLHAGAPLPRIALEVVAFAGEPEGDAARFSRLARSTLNLTPGSRASIPFAVAVEGRTGPVTVRVDDLPEGVRADPVVVRIPRPVGTESRAVEGSIVVRADGSAPIGRGAARLVALASPAGGPALEQSAELWLVFAPVPGETGSRPVVLRGTAIPVSVRNGGR